jgi:fumarate reductase subunit D
MRALLRVFSVIHAVMAAMFAGAALLLITLAGRKVWPAITSGLGAAAAEQVIESIGYLAAAVVALQIAQTIAEEEVVRAAHVSGPTRVRRFLSRFMVVLIVSLAIEGLVATFHGVHDDPAQLPAAATILAGTAALLSAWGIFIWCNRSAEDLEPEAMAEAKREDKKLR